MAEEEEDNNASFLRRTIYLTLKRKEITPFSEMFQTEAKDFILGHFDINEDSLTAESLQDLRGKISDLQKNLKFRLK